MKKSKNYLGRNFKKERENDKISAETRSIVMSKIRSTGTKLEETFIQEINKVTTIPYVLNVREIRGKPDIVFLDKKLCVFIDSDFWHGWQYPRWNKLLKDDKWRTKIENNRRRDRLVTHFLRRKGWKVVRIWEHNINKNIETEIKKVLTNLE
jgi:DNA mismatch endonuclease (patch repair protein)